MSYLEKKYWVEYHCSKCGKTYPVDELHYLCTDCSAKFGSASPLHGVLLAEYDYDFIKRHFNLSDPDWNLFYAVDPDHFPNFPHGTTPFYQVEQLSDSMNFKNIWIKNDTLNPSGSLKDRASFFVVAEANRLGVNQVVAASTGNAASSLAAVCAAAGKEAVIFAPASAPKAKLAQILVAGGRLVPVKGSYDDAFRLSIEYSNKYDVINRNTAYHPLTIEGKKTAGLEIFIQNGYQVPDAIIIPVGDGVILSGIFKAFYDLKCAGLCDKFPRLIAVQAKSSDAIVNYVNSGEYKHAASPNTVADSISVAAPSNAFLAKRAIEESGGFALTVSDEEIMAAQKKLTRKTGIFAEPSAAAVLAGLKKLENDDIIDKNEQVVLLLSGHGLKDIDSVLKNVTIPEAVEVD